MMFVKNLKFIIAILLAVAAIGAYKYISYSSKEQLVFEDFAYSNGRIESDEVSIAPKVAGRLIDIYVNEGDLVQKGQIVAKLDSEELHAKLTLAYAQVEQAKESKNYALALQEQKESDFALASENYARAKTLLNKNAIALAQFQQEQSIYKSAKAAQKAAKANVAQAQEAINVAIAQTQTIKTNIDENILYSPIMGRVLYKLAQNAEVIGSGQSVLVLLNPLDTYMSIFLSTSQAGVVSYGSDARIILDAFKDVAIPAKVTFVSPKAQFTPKQIETQDEREKLMFKMKVTIDAALLQEHIEKVKAGLPGVAYIRLNPATPWPEHLNNLPKSYVQSLQ